MTFGTSNRLAFAASALGTTLHLYTACFEAAGGFSLFLVGLFLWSSLPYALAALFAWRRPAGLPALGAACCCLVADGWMHYAVFVAPQSSTAALGLLFTPLWNLLVIGPVGAAVFWLAGGTFAPAQNAP